MKRKPKHFKRVEPVNKFSDIERQVENYPEIDTVIYSRDCAGRGHVYIALRSKTNTHGYGGVTIKEAEFNELREQFGERLDFMIEGK